MKKQYPVCCPVTLVLQLINKPSSDNYQMYGTNLYRVLKV